MRVLLDTHTFLWWAEDSPKLSHKARKVIEAPEHRCVVSLVCAWEMAVKISVGKLRLPAPLSEFFPQEMHVHDFDQLDINLRALCRLESLPLHHRDPFDRLLIAQALEEKLPVVTADPVFRKYGIKRLW